MTINKIIWIDLGVDADLYDGHDVVPVAAGARFKVSELSLFLGYVLPLSEQEIHQIAGELLREVSQGFIWGEEPWSMVKTKGVCVIATMGPGTIDQRSWDIVSDRFKWVCEQHKNPGARCEIGEELDVAKLSWFSAGGQN